MRSLTLVFTAVVASASFASAAPLNSSRPELRPMNSVWTTDGIKQRYFTDDSQYEDVKKLLRDLAARHRDTSEIVEVGPSDSGDTILALKVGDGPIHNLIVATHHGNEYGSTEVGAAMAASLAATPIAGQTLFIIPVLNIEGFNARQREESARGVSWDPNRDYPGPCTNDNPHNLKSTLSLARFVERHDIVASATLHTYWPAVVYPWGLSTPDTSTPYDEPFTRLVEAATQESHYATGNSTLVMYPADGTYEDYAFWRHGIWSLLFELGPSHAPNDPQIDQMIRVNLPGIRRFFEMAPRERATDHDFKGRCENGLRLLDLQVE